MEHPSTMHADPNDAHPRSLKGRHVHFYVKDAYVPEPAQILAQLHGQDLLQGWIVDVSDNNVKQEDFVVVEVEGLSQPVVVAASKLTQVEG